MITIKISDEMRESIDKVATEEAEKLGNLNGSIEDGDGNYAGIFAEELFTEIVGGTRDNTYDYDILYNGLKIDIKTKRRSVTPKSYYECSIADFNTSQDCDLYYFISVRYDYSKATFLGYISPDNYYEQAEFHEEGDVDPDNDFTFKADCWNLPIDDLKTGSIIEVE